MKFIDDDPEMPIPLLKALKDSNSKYRDELSSFLSESLIGKNDGIKHFSVTTLFKSPRELQLLSRHSHELRYDPMEFYFSLKGSIIHYMLEHYAPDHWELEKRMKAFRSIDGEKVMIHGQADAYDPMSGTLWDWKFTSGTSILYDKPEHKLQLNILAYIFDSNNIKVNDLRNCYLIERLDQRYSHVPGYPTKEFQVKKHDWLPKHETKSYIDKRIAFHLNEFDKKDKDLSFCTDEERWIRSNQHVIYKRKKGTKKEPIQDWSSKALFRGESDKDVVKFLAQNPQTEEVKVVIQKGYPKKCDYCKALPFCNQRQKELKEEAQQQLGLHD